MLQNNLEPSGLFYEDASLAHQRKPRTLSVYKDERRCG